MRTATILTDSEGMNVCCYNTICDTINVDVCTYRKATDGITYQLSPTNVDSVTFTFHGSTSPLLPTIIWNFGDGTTLVSSDLTVTHFYAVIPSDTAIYNVCADVIWSKGDTSVAFDSSGVCCCLDTICLNVNITPCAIPSFYISIDTIKYPIIDFQLNAVPGSTIVTSSYWTVTFPDGSVDVLGTGLAMVSPDFEAPYTGNYIICATYNDQVPYGDTSVGCSGSICDTVFMNGDRRDASFRAYPNPNSGQLIVEITNYQNAQTAKIEIDDMTGQPVMVKTISGLGKGISQNYLNLTGLSQGVYTIRMNIGDVQQVNKLVKE